jgi:hypothetical protein
MNIYGRILIEYQHDDMGDPKKPLRASAPKNTLSSIADIRLTAQESLSEWIIIT